MNDPTRLPVIKLSTHENVSDFLNLTAEEVSIACVMKLETLLSLLSSLAARQQIHRKAF